MVHVHTAALLAFEAIVELARQAKLLEANASEDAEAGKGDLPPVPGRVDAASNSSSDQGDGESAGLRHGSGRLGFDSWGGTKEDVRVVKLDLCWNAARDPVLDALHAAFVEAQHLGDFGRAAKCPDQVCVIHRV